MGWSRHSWPPGVAKLQCSTEQCKVTSRTDHYATTFGDKGWGCGFRNVQMLLSCLLHSTLYRLTLILI